MQPGDELHCARAAKERGRGNRLDHFTVLGMLLVSEMFGSLHFYWRAARNKVVC